jgi:cyanate lyase
MSSSKTELVERLLAAKSKAKLTFDQISAHLGVTNAYAAQLFMNQAQLKPATSEKLRELMPLITDEDIKQMMECPLRSFDPAIVQDPFVYRLTELMQHYGIGNV